LFCPDEKGLSQKRPVDDAEKMIADLPHRLLTATHREETMWTSLLGDEPHSWSESHPMVIIFPPASWVKMQVLHCIAGLAVPCGVARIS
jgi:hypothetical protein